MGLFHLEQGEIACYENLMAPVEQEEFWQ